MRCAPRNTNSGLAIQSAFVFREESLERDETVSSNRKGSNQDMLGCWKPVSAEAHQSQLVMRSTLRSTMHGHISQVGAT